MSTLPPETTLSVTTITESPPAEAVSTIIAANPSQIARLADEWPALTSACGPIEQYNWSSAAARTLTPADALQVVAIWRDGVLAAVAPLVRQRRLGADYFAMLGVRELHEPMGIPCRDRASAGLLLRQLIVLGRPLLFQRLPADSVAMQAINDITPSEAIVLVRPEHPCPFIDLDPSWAEPEMKLNSGRRSDLRRAMRRAEARGAVRAVIHAPTEDELPELLEISLDIEARNWKGRSGTALLHDQQRQAFFREYAAAANRDGMLRICHLHIGDSVVAMQLAAVVGGGFWLLKIGYDEAFAACSPGLLLMRETIRHAAQLGLKRYELLGLNAPWIEAWTRQQRECVCVRIYPTGLRGVAALAAEAAASAMRKVRGAS